MSRLVAAVIPTDQRGVALLTVMFILVLLTTAVVYMVEDEHLAIRRIENQRDAEQSYQLAAGAEQWALKILERDMKLNASDHPNEVWSALLPEVTVEQGALSARAVDLQGRFNLNNVSRRDEVWYPAFKRLLRVLELDEGLADAVLDWVDRDFDVSGAQGAEDPDYLLLTPSYRAANRAFIDIGELVWVNGFDDGVIMLLSPFVSAIPGDNVKININTAAPPVLRALAPDLLSEASVVALVGGRGEQGYADIQEFLASPELAGLGDIIGPLVATGSDYFEVHSVAEFGRITTALFSILERHRDTQQVTVIQRRRGLI